MLPLHSWLAEHNASKRVYAPEAFHRSEVDRNDLQALSVAVVLLHVSDDGLDRLC